MPQKRYARISLPFPIKIKTFSLSSLCLIIGFALGAHFFDELPPPVYQSLNGIQAQACFTPQHQCLPLILQEIRKAKQEILVQAYQLTSKPTAEALREAHEKGVTVKILADKSQETNSHSQIAFLAKMGIEVLIDSKPHIAHSKIILIDRKTLIGGSYNYSEGAEKFNAENVLILKNAPLIQEYLKNWEERYKVSRTPKINLRN